MSRIIPAYDPGRSGSFWYLNSVTVLHGQTTPSTVRLVHGPTRTHTALRDSYTAAARNQYGASTDHQGTSRTAKVGTRTHTMLTRFTRDRSGRNTLPDGCTRSRRRHTRWQNGSVTIASRYRHNADIEHYFSIKLHCLSHLITLELGHTNHKPLLRVEDKLK